MDIDGETRPNGAARDIGADKYYLPLPLENSTTSTTPSNIIAANGPSQTVSYTIVLTNPVGELVTATVADVLPSPAAPVTPGLSSGPTCTSGTCSVTGNTINWNGEIATGSQVTNNYSILVTAPITFSDTVKIMNNANLTYQADGVDQPQTINQRGVCKPY